MTVVSIVNIAVCDMGCLERLLIAKYGYGFLQFQELHSEDIYNGSPLGPKCPNEFSSAQAPTFALTLKIKKIVK